MRSIPDKHKAITQPWVASGHLLQENNTNFYLIYFSVGFFFLSAEDIRVNKTDELPVPLGQQNQ